MTALSNRYVTLQKEGPSDYGSEPVAATAKLFLGEVDDESFSQNFDLLTRTDISRYGASKSVQGLTYSEGDVNLPLQLDDFNSFCLFAAFGVDTFDASATPDTHTLTETLDDANFPSFCIRVGMEDKEHTYCGMVLNSLSLSANINEYVMMTYSFVGCGESAVGTLVVPGAGTSTSPPAFSTVDALHFAKAYVRFENVASSTNFSTLVKSISLEINMNRDQDNASSLGKATYAVAPPPQLREITGSIELNTNGEASVGNSPTYDELRGFLLHNGTNALPALMIRLEDGAATPNYFEIKFPKVVYEAPEMSLSGRDTSTLSMNFVVLFDETAGYMAKAVIGMGGIASGAAMTNAA
tara:strand:- start:11114 stop:12175 length:1062 start_codon:yes stop_codon:yes gene_type:complete